MELTDPQEPSLQDAYFELVIRPRIEAAVKMVADALDPVKIAERAAERKARFERIAVERLAVLEHEQWLYWVHQLSKSGKMPDWLMAKWKPFRVSFADLPEEKKEEDRIWARRVLKIFQEIAEDVR